MKIPKRFKEALEIENEHDTTEKTKINGKFKALLKHKNEQSSSGQDSEQKRVHMLPGRTRKYSDRKLLRMLKSEAKRLGRTPTAAHFQNSRDLPNPITYQHRWGSWNNAIMEAGLTPNFTIERKKVDQQRSTNATEVIHTGSRTSILDFQKVELYANLSDQEADGASAIQELGTHLSLNASAISESEKLYRRIVANGIHIGRTTSSIASATIYLACRSLKKPISLVEIAQTAGISQKKMNRTVRIVARRLKLEISPLLPIDVFDGISSRLLLEEKVKSSAEAILHNPITRKFSSGKNPFSVVAAAIYIAGLVCRIYLTQEEIAKAANVTEVTIRNIYRDLAEELEIDLGHLFRRR